MLKKGIPILLVCFFSLVGNGCVVRTYTVEKDRIDQEIDGNRGYIMGEPSESTLRPRSTTRKHRVVEIEMHPIKFGQPREVNLSKEREKIESSARSAQVDREVDSSPAIPVVVTGPMASKPSSSKVLTIEKYTVKKGDTLQKISKKFYGTSKRWQEIYDANRKILKAPDSIFPGQVIEIPLEKKLKKRK